MPEAASSSLPARWSPAYKPFQASLQELKEHPCRRRPSTQSTPACPLRRRIRRNTDPRPAGRAFWATVLPLLRRGNAYGGRCADVGGGWGAGDRPMAPVRLGADAVSRLKRRGSGEQAGALRRRSSGAHGRAKIERARSSPATTRAGAPPASSRRHAGARRRAGVLGQFLQHPEHRARDGAGERPAEEASFWYHGRYYLHHLASGEGANERGVGAL